jgi:hypothetical protein
MQQKTLKRAQRWWGEEYQGHELPPEIMIPLALIAIVGITATIALVSGGIWLFTGLLVLPAPALGRS